MVTENRKRPERERVQPWFEGIRTTVLGDPNFPTDLGSVPKAPVRLWYRGELLPSDSEGVGIVGARSCSAAGARRSARLGRELAAEGVTVVSGLAKGIDGAAHRGALQGGGRTVAVLGTGLRHVYPYEHRELGEAVAESGALVSQFNDPGFSGYRSGRNFVQRNVVIAAFSRVLVVVEAKKRSGSLSAVRAALAQGKPVGLLRSLVDSEKWASELSRSPGVFTVESTADVLERLVF